MAKPAKAPPPEVTAEAAPLPGAAPADAPAPAPAPRPTSTTAVKSTFVDDAGHLYQVPSGQEGQAEAMGWRPASLDESIQAERNRVSEGAASKVIAATTGAVPGLTTALVKGASLYGESPEEAASAIERSQEQHEGYYYGGMAASALIPGAATRGAGMLARAGVGTASFAEATAARAAATAAAKASTAAAATRVGGALRAAARAGLHVGAEGAAYGALAGMDEKVLGDPNANGEALVAAAAHSGAWGFLLGGALGGATGFAGGLLRRMPAASLSEAMGDAERAQSMGDRAFTVGGKEAVHEAAAYDVAVEKASQKTGVRSDEIRAAINEAQSAATTATESTLERTETEAGKATTTATSTGTINAEGVGDAVLKKIFGNNQEAYEAASAIWKERLNSMSVQEARLDANAGKLVDAGNAALRAEKTMQMAAFGEAKAEQMATLVDGAKWETAENATHGMLADTRQVTETLDALHTKGGAPHALNMVKKTLLDAEEAAQKLVMAENKTTAMRDYFVTLDSLKREVGKAAEFGKGMPVLNEGAKLFDKLYERLRVGMEDTAVWGKAGDAQREINAATSEALSTYKKFSRDFVHEYGAEVGRPTYEFRSDAAKNHLSNVLEFGERDKARGLNDWANGLERRLNAVEKNYTLTSAEKAEFQKGREALQELRKTYGEATKDASKVAKIRAMQAEERAGALGGTLGMLTSAFTQPISTVARLGEMKVAITSVGERISNAAKNIVEKQGTTTTATNREASRSLARTAQRIEGEASQEATSMSASASFEKRREATITAMARVRNASNNPGALTQNIAGAIARYSNHAPDTSASAAAAMGRGVGYLASKIPPGGPTQPSMQPFAQKPRYSDTEIRDFADRYLGVTNPLSLLDDMQNGTVSRAKVEAVREVYPEVFRQIQTKIALTAAASPKPLSWERIKMLAVVYGVPTHPAFDPAFIAAVQAPMQAAMGAPPEGTGPAQPSGSGRYSARPMDVKPANYQTPTERMAGL